ncbi:milk fat globule EGF and factor V/VIII domain containing b [Anableps anableps]
MEELARFFFWLQLLTACLGFDLKWNCSSNPCQNDGICENKPRRGDTFADYVCNCQPGFIGFFCQSSCTSYLGLEEWRIADSQITASSSRDGMLGMQHWGPERARLNNKGLVNAWSAAAHDESPWIQIDMQRTLYFTGIVMQGASRIGTAEYVQAFKVASSLSGKTYTMVKGKGQSTDQVFLGNTDNGSIKTIMFDSPIIAQYIRILPVVCHKACTLRMELVGCEINGCSEPVGMMSQLVSDSQITASSTFSTLGMKSLTWFPHYARLNLQGTINAWIPATSTQSEWLQVDLLFPKSIAGIITQGANRLGSAQFVSSFKIAHSNDGISWTILKDESRDEDKIFTGNSDSKYQKMNIFRPPFNSRYVRILPWEWNRQITLRMELLGCDN